MLRFLQVLLLAACLVGLLRPLPAAANPYQWVSVEATIVYGTDGVPVALRQAWRFDPHFSAFAAKGVDRDGNGRYTPEERAAAATLNVKALKKFDYFTKVTAGGRAVALGTPSGENLSLQGDQLTLRFTLPLRHAPAAEAEPLGVTVYDPAYFIAFALAPGAAVRLSGAPAGCAVRLERALQPPQPANAAEAAAVTGRPVALGGTAGKAHADTATVECGSDLLAFASPASPRFPPFAPRAATPPHSAMLAASPPAGAAAGRVDRALRLAAAKPLTDAGLLVPEAIRPAPPSVKAAPAQPVAAAAAPPHMQTPTPSSGRSATTAEPAAAIGINSRGLVAGLLLLGLGAAVIGGLLVRGSAMR